MSVTVYNPPDLSDIEEEVKKINLIPEVERRVLERKKVVLDAIYELYLSNGKKLHLKTSSWIFRGLSPWGVMKNAIDSVNNDGVINITYYDNGVEGYHTCTIKISSRDKFLKYYKGIDGQLNALTEKKISEIPNKSQNARQKTKFGKFFVAIVIIIVIFYSLIFLALKYPENFRKVWLRFGIFEAGLETREPLNPLVP
ncbi:MAG: hypothetical protein HQ536_00140 [Parcubacteria group bacterium]|nr:hypothetical protein [Parcubacteria group bacterium]